MPYLTVFRIAKQSDVFDLTQSEMVPPNPKKPSPFNARFFSILTAGAGPNALPRAKEKS
jgi:hypothetical protein